MAREQPHRKPGKKPGRPTTRELTVGLYLLRAKEMGLLIGELEELEHGDVLDMMAERANDGEEYPIAGTAGDLSKLFGG